MPSSFGVSAETPPNFGPTVLIVSDITSMYPLHSGAPFSTPCEKGAYPKQTGSRKFEFPTAGTFVISRQSGTRAPMMRPCPLGSASVMGNMPDGRIFSSTVKAERDSSRHRHNEKTRGGPLP